MLSLLTSTALIGGSTIAAELFGVKLKNKKNKIDDLANGKLFTKKDLENILGDYLQLSKNIKLEEKIAFEGTVIIAPTGGGKTTSFFIPNLLNPNLKGSIVAYDPKGELYEKTSWFQKNICGRDIVVFAPLEPSISCKYNLLEQCKDTTEVLQLASTLITNGSLAIELQTGKKTGGTEWDNMATPLFSAALLYCKAQGLPVSTIENAFRLIIEKSLQELDTLFSNSTEDCRTQWDIFNSVGDADRTIGSIKITLTTALKIFGDKKICKVLSGTSTFNPAHLRKKSTCIYIISEERRSSYVSPVMASFFSQLFDKVLDSYNKNSLPVYFFLDEFANLGMLNNMSVNCATVRSREISLNICLQSISQLEQIYGKDNALSILNNLKTKIAFSGLSDLKTLDYISQLCGNTQIQVCNTSITKDNTTKSYSYTTKKLFNKEDIRCLNEDDMLIVMHNKQPILDKKNIYYTQEKYNSKIKETPLKINLPTNNIIKNKSDEEKYINLFKENIKLKVEHKIKEQEENLILEGIKKLDNSSTNRLVEEIWK
ncbi:type IV secretory system conjugative DNA transfer family protein [Clostridium botulinum]|uniref:TraG/TraD family protein n=1 Tax=Clostridium botulinum (strain Langeland / NCTC 10281 / Type F) TaxID=441772 RepID=A7GI48_CLOBL|nr:type IV secretory system conjugative DNA transfer family protein [Clostridium botulinum]ABS40697.1 TraG/TraD family protein [Clostridium botulinum F str. Langeland]ADG00822.1 TraG/TraD family protein [Clostridium botulinum F str. 230613]KKM40671.1 conjugal transfer protein TraG [Clostridium botulinum]MBY6794353.1 type IV secretory system conjugative DNA transfer family protein [Clostridium botulinum]MBY6938141.1 type IV secretory system conjugative DNA transfer family protein [Clostridium b